MTDGPEAAPKGSTPGRPTRPSSERLPADAEQVERAPGGQRHQLDRSPALRAFTDEAQRVPAQRILAAEQQLGHVVDRGVEHQGAGPTAIEMRQGAHLLQRRPMLTRPRGRASSTSARAVRPRRRGVSPFSPERGRRAADE